MRIVHTLLVIAIALSIGSETAQANDREVTGIEIHTWGAPWTARFFVVIDSLGKMTVKKVNAGKSSPENKTVELSLTKAERKDIFSLAEKALTEPRRNEGCSSVSDGTSASLNCLKRNKARKNRMP